jgi:6-phosphogluconolactonase
VATRILSTTRGQVRVYRDPEELALKAARRFARLADQYVVSSGRFTVALSGGSTPKAMFSLLASARYHDTVPWSCIHFFWADERCVPPEHPDSNYGMASAILLSKVPVPPENIYRFPAERDTPARVAAEYSAILTRFFSQAGDEQPDAGPVQSLCRFDLVLLGMGPDGHTASLFPHTPALKATGIASANYVEKLKTHRLTLTATTINNARNVTFLVAGEDKADTLKKVLEGPYQPDEYPSQLIQPTSRALLWMVDEAAARLIDNVARD